MILGERCFDGSRDRDPFPVNRSWNDGCPGETKGSASLVKSGSSIHATSPRFTRAIALIIIACCVPAVMMIWSG